MMFPIPEEVAYELSRNDVEYDSEYETQFDHDRSEPWHSTASKAERKRLGIESRRKQDEANRSKNPVTCPHCGFKGLVRTETVHGPRLTYVSGVARNLIGKIHACEHEFQ